MNQRERSHALADLAAAIERALDTSLPAVAHQALAEDELTERLLYRNFLQLTYVAADLRRCATQLAQADPARTVTHGQDSDPFDTRTVAA